MAELILAYGRAIGYALAALFLGLFVAIQKETSRKMKNLALAMFFIIAAFGIIMRFAVGPQAQVFINDWFGTPAFVFFLFALVRDFWRAGRNGHSKNGNGGSP